MRQKTNTGTTRRNMATETQNMNESAPASRPPNILFIIADDHRATDLGCYGNHDIATPNLDKLSKQGLTFDNAHCQGAMHPAVCVPSRASIMTGHNIFASSAEPTGGSYYGRSFDIPDALPTFPEILRENGYQTHCIGKWHNDRSAFHRSFDGGSSLMFGGMSEHRKVPLHHFDPSGTYPADDIYYDDRFSTDIFSGAAVEFLEGERHEEKPFCLYLAFTAPHDPRTPPAGFRPSADELVLPKSVMAAHPFDNGDMRCRDELLASLPRENDEMRDHLADYYGMIQHLDAEIGRVLDSLDATGQRQNTLVIYTSDHGLALGNHGLMGKQNLYQHSVRVPLVFSGPGIPIGQRASMNTWHGDTFATLLDYTGLSIPTCDGESLLPVFADPHSDRERAVFAAYRYSQRMVRDARYKLIRYYTSERYPKDQIEGSIAPSAGTETTQLFDLLSDPNELDDLVASTELNAIRVILETRLSQWQIDVGDPLMGLNQDQTISSV